MQGISAVRRLPAEARARYRSRLAERRQRQETDARAAAYRQPLDPSQVFYESFSGNGMLCNPEAIFRRLLATPDLQHLRHVWALDDLGKHAGAVRRWAEDPRVRFVEMRSPEYVRELARSGFVVNNATFPQEFAKREGQVYLNTWHGTPLKKMGYDLPDGGTAMRNVLRNMVSADYLLSSSPFMTDRMYREAFRLQGVFRGTVIEEGQPRVDVQLAAAADRGPVVAALEAAGLAVGDRKVVLYAPTWKGAALGSAEANPQQLVRVVRRLQESLDPAEHVVLLKTHQAVHDAVLASGRGRQVLVPNDIPTNEVLGVTDLLVTDYSSIFFDFLVSGRPIFHHVPDLDQYTADRGLYLEEHELFGPVSRTVDELAAQVREAAATGWQPDERRRQAVATYAPREDGAVTDRVIDIVFRGADPAGYRTRSDLTGSRPTLLVHIGGLAPNGLTASTLNLLRTLDHDRFDVSVLYPHVKGRERAKRLIDPRCRQFVRVGGAIATAEEVARERRYMEVGLPDPVPASHREYWRAEWRRVFGEARFDYGIDLNGFGSSIPYLLINGEVGERSVWLHSDMRAESERETEGVKHLQERLHAVFTTYRHFDHLVSVSEELRRVNAQALAAHAPAEKFTFAPNTIDADRVLQMAGRDGAGPGSTAAPADPTGTLVTAPFDTGNVSSAVAALLEHFEPDELLAEVRSQARVAKAHRGQEKVFVHVGRLSPEKNQARLLRAFARVVEQAPEARLVVVGSGRLDRELRALSRSLGLQDVVTFTGQVENPYVVMAGADCFVLSSDHEGQPMVVLEARTLGLPVISTRFDSVEGSVPPEAGLVVDRTDEALTGGMLRFLAGEVRAEPFDAAAYNAEAVRQFYAAIGAARHVEGPAAR